MSSVSHLNWHEMTNQFLKAPSFPALVAAFRVVDARVSHEGAAERKIRVQFVTAPSSRCSESGHRWGGRSTGMRIGPKTTMR